MKKNQPMRQHVSYLRMCILFFALLCGVVHATWASAISLIEKSVTGTVTEENGAPIPGVSVTQKGSTRGTTTDINGNFKINVDNEKSILAFSFVGYIPQEIEVGSQSNLTVKLKVDTKLLTEVVVVGYGSQKKANLTGAVDQVSSEVFDNRPLTNLNQGLQGVMPNLNIKMGDGKPNQAPSFNIRGTTSIGQGGNALVLIDNVEGDPSLLNPNDIASITLLKDAASASIYGARGVFGVVLITTKNPAKGKTSVTYSSNYSLKNPIAVPDLVTDGYTFASMFAESFVNFQGSFPQNVNKTMKFSLGGSGLNSSRILAAMGQQDLLFFGAIGNDQNGKIIKEILKRSVVASR